MPLSAILFLAVLIAGTVIVEAWPWISTLSQGAGAFLGALSGLLAILAGALLNAHLNRRRDDRLRAEERLALLEGLVAELELYRNLLQARAVRARTFPNLGAALRDHLRLVAPPIYTANLARLGLMGGRLTAIVAHAYALIADIDAFVATMPTGRVAAAGQDIATRFLSTRRTVSLAHQILMAEITALGGPTSLHVSDDMISALYAEHATDCGPDGLQRSS